jgi:hypothetical protein
MANISRPSSVVAVGPWLGKRAEIRPPVGYLGKGVHAVARAARQPVKARILVLMPAAFARRCIIR